MKKLVNVLAPGLLALLLAGCGEKQAHSEKVLEPVAQTAAVGEQRISLLADRFSLAVPANLQDRSGELSSQTNNMQVFSDDSGRQNVVVLVTESNGADLAIMADEMANRYLTRDSKADIIAKRAVNFGEHPGFRLEIISNASGQEAYSSILMTIIDHQLVTVQIVQPEGKSASAKQLVEQIVHSVVIK